MQESYFVEDQLEIKEYKLLDIEPDTVLRGNIQVECERTFNELDSINYYVLVVGGTYLEDNGVASYYFVKFNTLYGLSEYFVQSRDDQVMEQLKGVEVDVEREMIYVAVEVNKNNYHQSSIYEPGTDPGYDNSNIAVVAYSWEFGVREWVLMAGNEDY